MINQQISGCDAEPDHRFDVRKAEVTSQLRSQVKAENNRGFPSALMSLIRCECSRRLHVHDVARDERGGLKK